MPLLSDVLTVNDLPAAELCAARLDGELVPLDDAYACVDVPDSPVLRALGVARSGIPPGCVLELWTAAWVHGTLARAPDRVHVCIEVERRSRVSSGVRVRVRERRIRSDDIVVLGGVRVTTPARTALDLARVRNPPGG